jgi:hypothetical protein
METVRALLVMPGGSRRPAIKEAHVRAFFAQLYYSAAETLPHGPGTQMFLVFRLV